MADGQTLTISKRIYWRRLIKSLIDCDDNDLREFLSRTLGRIKAEPMFAPLIADFDRALREEPSVSNSEIRDTLGSALYIIEAQPAPEIDEVAKLQIREAVHLELRQHPFVRFAPQLFAALVVVVAGGTTYGGLKFKGLMELAQDARTKIESAVASSQQERDNIVATGKQVNQTASHLEQTLIEKNRQTTAGWQRQFGTALQQSNRSADALLAHMGERKQSVDTLAASTAKSLAALNSKSMQDSVKKADKYFSDVEDIGYVRNWARDMRTIGSWLHLGDSPMTASVLTLLLAYALLRAVEEMIVLVWKRIFQRRARV